MMRKAVTIVLVLLLVAVIGFFTYICLGLSNQKVKIQYNITINNPANAKINVKMLVLPVNKPYLHLFLRDSKAEGVARIKLIEVKSGNKALPMWQTVSGISEFQTVWLGFRKEPVEINYTIDANCAKGQKLTSFLGPEFGYLRGMNTFYTPVTLKDIISMIQRLNSSDENAGIATLGFSLPPNWQLNSPWNHQKTNIRISYLRNVYFGLGNLTITKTQSGPIALSIGIYDYLETQDKEDLLNQVPRIPAAIQKLTGIKPFNKASSRAITILPHEPIYGGAAGANSLVVENSLQVISHEIFHWWNGETIDATMDANWIKEGFTTYYAAKILLKSGLMGEADFITYLGNLKEELWQYNNLALFNLIKSSKKLIVGRGDDQDYWIVYNGGALVAHYLDEELQKQNKSLDDIWKLLYQHGNPVSTNDFIRILSRFGGKPLSEGCRDMVNGRMPIY